MGASCLLLSNPTHDMEAHSRAVVLEMIGDLPEADAKPPSNMLFIRKLHAVTGNEVRAWHSVVAVLSVQ